MKKTLVIWRRFGKEQGEDSGFRRNPPDVVSRHIERKRRAAERTEPENWEWYRLSDDVIIEFPVSRPHYKRCSTFYYLPKRHWAVMDRLYHPDFDPPWRWYIHIGDTYHAEDGDYWIFKDLFADVLIQEDAVTHTVYDLHDVAEVLDKGIIDPSDCSRILQYTHATVSLIQTGAFPPPELAAAIEEVENGDGGRLRPKLERQE